MPRKLLVAVVALLAILFVYDKRKARHKPPPLPVSATITHFAPGLAIGSTVEESAKSLQSSEWVRDVGLVGALSGSRGFSRARLFVDAKERSKPSGDRKALVSAVELIATRSDSIAQMMFDLAIAFRGNPKDGCIVPAVEGMPHRRVQYWSTRSDEGGVALITDWGSGRKASSEPTHVVVWSILAWNGPFQGSPTLLANYDPRTCLDVAGMADAPATPATTSGADAIASETAQLAFRDSLHAAETGENSRVAAGRTPLVGGEAVDACNVGSAGAFEPQSTALFELDMPADFALRDREKSERNAIATGYARYEWRAPDNSTLSVYAEDPSKVHSGWTGAISSECDMSSISGPMHVDIANASVSVPDRVVHAIVHQPGKLSLVLLGHARSLERQAQLLRVARSVQISPKWGSK